MKMVETDFVPYEQLPDEGAPEWAAFVKYRDIGPTRNLSEASRLIGCSKTSVTKWAKAYDWLARTRAWDAEVDRVRRQRFLSEQRRIIKLHAEAAGIVRAKAMEAVALIHPEDLIEDPRVAIKWLEFATKLEAQSCGLPTEVTALSLSGGQPTPTADVYFDSLPDDKLLDIVTMSIEQLQREKRDTDAISERERHPGEDHPAAGAEGEG